jgi:phosphate starvation-inducible PhoH-like protein
MPKIEAKTQNQQKYIDSIVQNKITFCDGPAGTGKTFVATLCACYQLIEKKIDRIVISRPLVQADVSIGHLPGTLEEKLAPYIRPVMDVMEEVVNKTALERYMDAGKIEILPFTTMQGRTLANTFTIIEESQNCTFEQIVLALTRFGKNSRMVLSGDSRQSYLPGSKQGGLATLMQRLEGLKGVGLVYLDNSDIVREPIVKTILERLDEESRPSESIGA